MTNNTALSLSFQPFPQLETKRLHLRQITMADVEQIFFLRSDEAVIQYLHRAPAKNTEEAAVWINNLEGWEKSFSGITWGLCTKESNELIGTIVFGIFNRQTCGPKLDMRCSRSSRVKVLCRSQWKKFWSMGLM